MKKLFTLLLLFPMAVCFILPQTASAKRIRNWQELLAEGETIKIYIEDIKNSTGDNNIQLKGLKTDIENALRTRMSTDFDLVTAPDEASVILKSDITEYYWTLEDPIDEIHSSASLAIDIMKKEHYVRMTVDFILLYVPTNKVIWQNPIKATITDNNMSEEDSYKMVNERIVKVFVRNLFKKNRGSQLRVRNI